MTKYYLLLFTLLMGCGEAEKHYPNGVCIGRYAGELITGEKFFVIVGEGAVYRSARGEDMIWLVDWNSHYLVMFPEIKKALWKYYNEYVLTGRDCKRSRKALLRKVADLMKEKPEDVFYT